MASLLGPPALLSLASLCLLPAPSLGARAAGAQPPEARLHSGRSRRHAAAAAAAVVADDASEDPWSFQPAALAQVGGGGGSCGGGGAAAAREASEGSEAAAVAVKGPAFNKERFQAMLKTLRKKQPQKCGSVLTHQVYIPADTGLSLMPAKNWLSVAEQKGIPSVRAMFWKLRFMGVPRGLKVLRIGATKGPFRNVADVAHALRRAVFYAEKRASQGRAFAGYYSRVQLVFELGLDLRTCWGNLEDLEGRPVCGPEVISDLASKVLKMEQPKMDSAGQSGSTIITNLRDHIIKSSTHEEYRLMSDAMPKIRESIEDRYRKFGGCWSTGLAPICAALVEPLGNPGEKADKMPNTIWLLTREIALPGDEYPPIEARTSWFDLKGPFFKGWSDGKSKVSREMPIIGNMLGIKGNTWTKKDEGFSRFFHNGLALRGCGSRDAVIAMVGDSTMLRDQNMTDYSLFGRVYSKPETPGFLEQGCICNGSTRPKFPIVLQIDKQERLFESTFWAVGIIDYIEQRVNRNGFGADFSTMKAPAEFAVHWADMFTHYFKLPPRSCWPEGGREVVDEECTMVEEDHQEGEVIKASTPVMTLRHILGKDAVLGEYTDALLPAGSQGVLASMTKNGSTGSVLAMVRWEGALPALPAQPMPWEALVGVPRRFKTAERGRPGAALRRPAAVHRGVRRGGDPMPAHGEAGADDDGEAEDTVPARGEAGGSD